MGILYQGFHGRRGREGPLRGGQVQTPARISLCLCPTLAGYGEVTLPERNPSLGSFLIRARVRWKNGLGWILRPGGHPKNLTRLGGSRGVPRNRGTNAGARLSRGIWRRFPRPLLPLLEITGRGRRNLNFESRYLLSYPWLARTHEFQPQQQCK